MTRGARSGITLVLIAGILVMLSVMGVLLLAMASQTASTMKAVSGACAARLSAASGLQYAAARLSYDAAIRSDATIPGRGDDWACRDAVTDPLAEVMNPSYSHGEGWADQIGGASGVYEPGLDDLSSSAWADRDGDGRFSAWSGRLRGQSGRTGGLFRLRVDPAEGRIPLNAPLDKHVDGYKQWLTGITSRLGGLLLEPGPGAPGRTDHPAGTEIGRKSALGDLLVRDRPATGYPTLDDVRSLLAAEGYSEGNIRKILAHVSLGPYVLERITDDFWSVPVSIPAATREILASFWLYASAGGDEIQQKVDAETGAWAAATCARSGKKYSAMDLIMFQDEAEGLADAAIEARKEGFTWQEFIDVVTSRHAQIFQRDLADLAPWPRARASWWTSKAKAAVNSCVQDATERTGTLLAARYAWGLPPAPATSASWSFGAVRRPDNLWLSKTNSGSPFVTTRSPSIFEVTALGAGGDSGRASASVSVAAGYLRANDPVLLSTQEDFENPGASHVLAAAGIGVVDDPGPVERRPVRMDGGRTLPAVVAGPGWNVRSGTGTSFSSLAGFLALAGSEGGPLGADQYWAFREDFDGDPATDFLSEPGPGQEVTRFPASPAPWSVKSAGVLAIEAPWAVSAGQEIDAVSFDARVCLPPGGKPAVPDVVSLADTGPIVGPVPLASLKVTCARAVSAGVIGTQFTYTIQFGASKKKNLPLFVPDAAPVVQPGVYHVIATLKRAGVQTRMRLYVNGAVPVETYAPFVLQEGDPAYDERLSLADVDDFRLYGRAIDDDADFAERFLASRYMRPGSGKGSVEVNPVYLSPRLDPGPAARAVSAQWAGATNAAIAARVGMEVVVRGLDASGSELWREIIERGRRTDLAVHKPCRYLAYSVEFFSSGNPGDPVPDTPAFHEIRFNLLRSGRAPAWIDSGNREWGIPRPPPPPDSSGGPGDADDNSDNTNDNSDSTNTGPGG